MLLNRDRSAPADAGIKMSRFLRRGLQNRLDVKAPLDNRKTKIVCTIGPVTQPVDRLADLLHAGMNVARMNFSHGTHSYHQQTIANVREASKQTGIPVAILLDTKGPEIRTTKLKGGKPILLESGQKLVLFCTPDRSFEGDVTRIGVDYLNLPNIVSPGDIVKIDDGLIVCQVLSQTEDTVVTSVQNSAELGETKGVNLPGVVVDLPAITEKDREDLLFGVAQNIDIIAASFARKAADMREIRDLIGPEGANISIVAKIESEEGLDNFDEILEECDGIMVARGDLGVEIPIQKVCMAQKQMIRKCNIAGKPVITATQMLESMVKNPRPTRAEATDVANAVFDGTDCVMLSGETAKGKFPTAAVSTMARICVTSELAIDYQAQFMWSLSMTKRPLSRPEAIASSAVKTETDLDAALIIVLTQSGASARYVAKYRPSVPIITVTSDSQVFRQLLVSRAVWPIFSAEKDDEKLIEKAIADAKQNRWVTEGEWVVVVSGTAQVTGSAHTLKVVKVV